MVGVGRRDEDGVAGVERKVTHIIGWVLERDIDLGDFGVGDSRREPGQVIPIGHVRDDPGRRSGPRMNGDGGVRKEHREAQGDGG